MPPRDDRGRTVGRGHAGGLRAAARRVSAVALVGLTAGPAALALAAAGSTPVVVDEKPGGTAARAPDLTRVSLQRGRDGRLRAGITLAAPLRPKDLRAAAGPPGSVCLRVYTAATPGVLPPDYLVCVTADAKGRAFRGSVLAEQVNALPRRVAAATVSRTAGRSLVVRFSQSAVGRPSVLSFMAEATRAGCIRAACVDTLPDAPGTAKLTLRPGEAPPER